jgi:T-complex protein 1 subunit alpha
LRPFNHCRESNIFAKLAVKAALHVKSEIDKKVPIRNIHIVQAHGRSSTESAFFEGYILRTSRVSQ